MEINSKKQDCKLIGSEKSMRKKLSNSNKQENKLILNDNESVNSDKSSLKNAQLIAAALNSDSPRSSEMFSIDFNNRKLNDKNSLDEIIDDDENDNFSTSTQSSSSQFNNVSIDFNENSKHDESNDSLANTIAKVASGSISSETKKIIEKKQNDMIRKSRSREQISDKTNFRKNSKITKRPRFRRTKEQMRLDAAKASAAVDAVVTSLLTSINNSKPRLTLINQKNISCKRKRVLILKSKLDNLRRKKLLRNKELNKQEGDDNEKIDTSKDEDVETKKEHDPIRTCLICKTSMHQDELNDHVMKHFYDSAKCCSCTKVSSNPANFVVHVLTHLPPQFFCVKCDKWYRQGVLYKRHKQECSKEEITSSTINSTQQSSINTRQKRKSSIDTHELQIASQELIESIKRRRQTRQSNIKQESIEPKLIDKRKPGRPIRKPSEIVEEETTKRKYNRKVSKVDMSRKKALRSFGKKNDEPKSSRLRRRLQNNEQSDFEDIESDKESKTESTSEIDELDEVVVSDIELDEEESKPSNEIADTIATISLKPNQDLMTVSTYKVKIQPSKPCVTPSKKITTPSKSQNQQQTSASFECPECDKKFVSYFGLVQHYDQHPNLSVYCQQCDMTFENHYGLVVHNSSVHQIVESQYLKSKLKQSKKEEVYIEPRDDLSSIPSIMTRTSRLNPDIQKSVNQSQPSHLLDVKTTGFADLALIDFSCMNFPLIAQNLCELWPRKNLNQNEQPLHNYKCNKCGFYFPCSASLKLHNSKKFCCKLFMTNSRYNEYDKTLNEIVQKLEQKEEKQVNWEQGEGEKEFMSWFGLVETPQVNQDDKNVLANLRREMLEINHDFNKDLDTWKLTHSSLDSYEDFSSKIHLKPFVNLTRPLLIRSKKLKRNTQKFVLTYSKSEQPLNTPKTIFTKPFFSATTTGNFSAAAKKVDDKKRRSSPIRVDEKEEDNPKRVKAEPIVEKIPEPIKVTKLIPVLPILPTLVKAPIVQIPTQFTSANSSRLASASGMSSNFSNFRPIMPKLLAINGTSTNLTTPPTIMPKLRKYKQRKTAESKIVQNKVLKPIAPKPIDDKSKQAITTTTTTTMPDSSLSLLKCKFCMQIFTGQTEFFQHVILAHPKMVKQKLNRTSTGNSSGSNSSTSSNSSSSSSSTNGVSDNLTNTN